MVVFGQFFANRAQYIDAFQKILLIYAIAIGEIVQRHLEQDGHIFALHTGFLHKLRFAALQHVQGGMGDGTETATLQNDRFAVKHLGRMYHFAARIKQRRLSQTAFHQLQGHQSVVDPGIVRSRKAHHANLRPPRFEVIQ